MDNSRFQKLRGVITAAAATLTVVASGAAWASSHMDAPLITLDDAANTTDVYAFVAEEGGRKYLATALSVYPFQEPGIGPNNFRFDDDVLYEIHVATGKDLDEGRATYSYQFQFDTKFDNPNTILQSYLVLGGPVGIDGGRFTNVNLRQTYSVVRIDHRRNKVERLGYGVVPPNNQGLVTPLYNEDRGNGPALGGVADERDLDAYTELAIAELEDGHRSFAGQRDDGFYADIQAIFDGLAFRQGEDRFDSQGGFNVHTISLNIPVEEIGGERQRVGVYATTSRRSVTVLRRFNRDFRGGSWVQVGRQGNPLFCEGLVALADKDLYNRTSPRFDRKLFAKYADSPELAAAINIALGPQPPVQESGQADLVGIFIPDLIRVDLSTDAARLAGGADPSNSDDEGFSRLGVFGGDVLVSELTGEVVPGGWPNGRRFGDDVVDIAITAILNDLTDPDAELAVADGIDNVNANDTAYNKVFPYAAPPLNGRNHPHH